MSIKTNWLEIVLRVIKKESHQDYDEDSIKDYEDYLNKPQEFKDKTIKSMYADTKFANESPEKLREIFKAQRAKFDQPIH